MKICFCPVQSNCVFVCTQNSHVQVHAEMYAAIIINYVSDYCVLCKCLIAHECWDGGVAQTIIAAICLLVWEGNFDK